MIKQTAAKIFLSDNREMQVSDLHRSFSTFSSGEKQNTHRSNFSGLYVLNDEELAGSASKTFSIKRTSYVILLPITGDLLLKNRKNEQERINVGEVGIINVTAGSSFQLSNPFKSDVINYLQLMIGTDEMNECNFAGNFELEENRLIEIQTPLLPFYLTIGRFSGRKEGCYQMKNPKSSGLFSFVIAGAFELENRLLHMRDGLALHLIEEAEFEALSEGAILLFIELIT